MLSISGFVTEFAPAKLNLSLHIAGQRNDGYHLLESLVVFADVGDEVQIQSANSDIVTVDGPFASGLEPSTNNLVAKARDILRAQHNFAPVHIHLTKNLPVSAGMGGGSSDAAATLRALAKLFAMQNSAIADVAISLGADVPMCLAARPLIAGGIGERLTAVPDFPDLHLVLANPNIAVSTPDVFKQLSNRNNPALPELPSGLAVAAFAEWLSRTRNDLQIPALKICPEIGDTLLALAETGPLLVRMSGSGATCYGLFPDASTAAIAADLIAARHLNWWVKPAKTGGSAHAR